MRLLLAVQPTAVLASWRTWHQRGFQAFLHEPLAHVLDGRDRHLQGRRDPGVVPLAVLLATLGFEENPGMRQLPCRSLARCDHRPQRPTLLIGERHDVFLPHAGLLAWAIHSPALR